MKKKKSIITTLAMVMCLSFPIATSASTTYPDSTVSIIYNSSTDVYRASGSGGDATTQFLLSPTVGLSNGKTISTLFTMENTSRGGIVPSHWIGLPNTHLQFKNMYASSGNDSDASTWSVNISVSGTTSTYRYTFGDNNTGDFINPGQSVNAWVDYNWTGTSNTSISNLMLAHGNENWTFLNGWTASGLFAMDAQIGSKSSMYLETGSRLSAEKNNANDLPDAELLNIKEERKQLDLAIESGQAKPINPKVTVNDESGREIWSGKADEWNKVQDEVFKQNKLGIYSTN
ncbi:hypothetical protein PVOR_10114 [Paenibacillus vortex V453]|uniref:Uncharacterized protein n=3 Tax=Paenibacillus TaxID=44249 RepID=A0A163KU90_9BACL|nr:MULTISPECIES: hypothetical protein [Paenibacillus]ANA81477.1 hypothetical protein A3958_16560 [Paenibacillus glucanolyticus]AVV59793.1 hypothetical protein C7121_28495 [Paenibacillus glucanolyticus]EFU41890.1 hypothetical protein PVOR_10114 [Paenibacillus vortex V453]ETT33416.1 hypothetical protein C169_22380 [Paenibacillus sp. FSL R5-808]KZS47524.1 hypothetical protein AWU65_17155 [Paenibacillus glucanolyticus]